jgi:8-oxo-dGTP pyrophosphatase MutT (NUDIX family)
LVDAETIHRLPRRLKVISEELGANAAVALILKPGKNDFEILLVKRAKNPEDPWSGQMALPGGKRERGDSTLKAAVIRETFEETSIDIAKARFLGVLNPVQSVPRRDLLILPFVVLLKKVPEIRLDNHELESCIWAPYEKIVASEGASSEGAYGNVTAFLLGAHVVWGITYTILKQFGKVVEAVTAR